MKTVEFRRPQINRTRELKVPNYYTLALDGEFRDYAFSEERGPLLKGRWRKDAFGCGDEKPVDLEIGTGNGTHFQHRCVSDATRGLVGIELKYKPLIQTIRGALRKGAKNGRVVRFHAFNIDELFTENELNNVYIHFPDPWTSPRKPQNRLINPRTLDLLWSLQRPGSFLDFKTDSREYFLWALEPIRASKYKIEAQTMNLQASSWAQENFVTQFESIFLRQGLEINFIRLRKEA